jgi:hypothetical protein
MGIREHVAVFWQMVRRWPRWTTMVLGAFAVFYFLYYAGVEAMEIPQSLAAALGMVLLLVAFKVGGLTAFYRLYERNDFAGSFLLLGALAAVPLVLALAIAMLVVRQDIDGPPPDAVPFLLSAAALVYTVCVAGTARFSQWVGTRWRSNAPPE